MFCFNILLPAPAFPLPLLPDPDLSAFPFFVVVLFLSCAISVSVAVTGSSGTKTEQIHLDRSMCSWCCVLLQAESFFFPWAHLNYSHHGLEGTDVQKSRLNEAVEERICLLLPWMVLVKHLPKGLLKNIIRSAETELSGALGLAGSRGCNSECGSCCTLDSFVAAAACAHCEEQAPELWLVRQWRAACLMYRGCLVTKAISVSVGAHSYPILTGSSEACKWGLETQLIRVTPETRKKLKMCLEVAYLSKNPVIVPLLSLHFM